MPVAGILFTVYVSLSVAVGIVRDDYLKGYIMAYRLSQAITGYFTVLYGVGM
jgi:hypothetical protein